MTPPSIERAVEILTEESASIRAARDAYPVKVLQVAAAIDVVLAALDQRAAPAPHDFKSEPAHKLGSDAVSATTHDAAIPTDAHASDMLPCPFCGRRVLLGVEMACRPASWASPRSAIPAEAVWCRACGAWGPASLGNAESSGEAIAHWNRRKPAPGAGRVVPFLDERGHRIGDAFIDGLQILAARVTDAEAAEVLRTSSGQQGVSLGYQVDAVPAEGRFCPHGYMFGDGRGLGPPVDQASDGCLRRSR